MQILLFLYGILLVLAAITRKTQLKQFDIKNTLPLRGLLAILIVAHHHAMEYIHMGSLIDNILYQLNSIGAPIVAIFFFLTGYGLASSLKKKGPEYLNGFLPKRLKSFIPEFLFFTTIATVAIWINTGLNPIEQLWKLTTYGNPPLKNSWFLYVIVYIYCSFYLAAKISRCNIVYTGICFSLLICVSIVILSINGFGEWWYSATISTIFGYIVKYYENTPPKTNYHCCKIDYFYLLQQ